MFSAFSLYVHAAATARDLECLELEPLNEALEPERFRECEPGQPVSIGWSPVDGWDELAYQVRGWILWRFRLQERVVPPKALAEAVEKEIRGMEAREGGPVHGPRRREAKDEVRARLIAQAPTQSHYLWMGWCAKRRLFAIEGTNTERIESALSLLRATLGSLPVHPIAFSKPAEGTLTTWLRSADLPAGVRLGDRAVLVDPHDTANKITYVGQSLDEDEVTAALQRGMAVKQMQIRADVGADEDLRFVVNDACRFRNFETPMPEAPEGDNGDPVAALYADLLVRTVMIERAVDVLISGMGPLAND